MNIELGISSFGETTPLETTGKAISHDQRIRDLLEEIILADKLNIDAFDLFGYDLENYDELFIEKLEMLLKMNKEEILDWPKGKFTPRVDHKGIYPRTKKPIPISVATGGSIESTIRTAELGLPIVY